MEDTFAVAEDQATAGVGQGSIRLCRARATLLYFEGTRYDFSGVRVHSPMLVSVTDSSARVLGCAVIHVTATSIEAEIKFDYASPERLELQLESDLYAHLKGWFTPAGSLPASFYSSPEVSIPVSDIHIHGVVLSLMRPADPRIQKAALLPD